MNDVVTLLSEVAVVDRQRLNSLKAEDLNSELSKAYASGKRVMILDKLTEFFSFDSLEKSILIGDENLEVILEFNNISVAQSDINTLREAVKIKAQLAKDMEEARLNRLPTYPFATIPVGWSVDNNLRITKIIKRIVSVHGTVDHGYSIGLKAAERVWDMCAPYWAGLEKRPSEYDLPTVRASGYYNRVTVRENEVQVGCQVIHRHELEQVAAHLGWQFPTKVKKGSNADTASI